MTPNNAIGERTFTVVAKILNVPRDSLNPDTSREDAENWDSLKHMYIVLALEEEFSVEFNPDEIASMKTIADLVGAVASRAGAA